MAAAIRSTQLPSIAELGEEVEVAKTRPAVTAWRKSSLSAGSAVSCVEERWRGDGLDIRDSKDPGGRVLSFPGAARGAFHEAIRSGLI